MLCHLFNLHPHNTCQITHIDPIIKVYRGTLSNCDLKILSILQLFEKQRKLSVASLLSSWSTTPNSASTAALEALQSLDPTIVFLTCTNFPQWRRIQVPTSLKANTADNRLYDPVFLLLLFNQMMAERLPSSSIAWLELLRTNVVSLFLRSLSARDGQIRELALCQVISLWKCLEVRRRGTLWIQTSQSVRTPTFKRGLKCNIYSASSSSCCQSHRCRHPNIHDVFQPTPPSFFATL